MGICQFQSVLSNYLYPLVVVVEVVVVVVVEVVVVPLTSPATASLVPGAIVIVVVTGSGHTVVRASTHLQHSVSILSTGYTVLLLLSSHCAIIISHLHLATVLVGQSLPDNVVVTKIKQIKEIPPSDLYLLGSSSCPPAS